jgi:hypothetical protein
MVLILDPGEEAIANMEGDATMKWSIGLILGLSLALGASVSHGEWQMEVHQGQVNTQFNLSEIDSLSFPDGFPGMVWIPAGNVRLGQTGIAEPINDFCLLSRICG